jgi:hypothetical protein
MDSLLWVDQTYVQKHKTEDPHNLRALYHQNLDQYPHRAPVDENKTKTPLKQAVILYATKQGRKAAISLAVLGLSYVPYVGRFVLPAASFYTFRKAVGTPPAGAIFAVSLLFPRRYLVTFLQAYFSSRTLMRELVCDPIPTLSAVTDTIIARALLRTGTLQQRPEEAVVQGSRRRTLRLRTGILHLCQDPTGWRAHLRSCGSLNGIPHHQGHRPAASTYRSREVQGRFDPVEEQARIPQHALAQHGHLQHRHAQASVPVRGATDTAKDLQLDLNTCSQSSRRAALYPVVASHPVAAGGCSQ